MNPLSSALPARSFVFLAWCLLFAAQPLFALPPGYSLQEPPQPALQQEAVSAIAVSREKVAWGLTSGLLVVSKDGTTTFWNPANSPLTTGEFAGIALRDQEIWCATRTYGRGNGVCHFDGKKWHHLVSGTHGILSNLISAVHIDQDHFVWIGFDRLGVSKYIGDVNPFRYFEEFTVKDGLLVGKVHAILMQETHLWTGMSNGISRVRTEVPSKMGRNIDSWTVQNGFPGNNVVALARYGKSGIVAGTDTGLAFWDGTQWKSVGRREGLKVGRVLAIAVQGEAIWIGGLRGLQRWTPTLAEPLLTSADGLPESKITALAIENPGSLPERLLIGTEMGAAILIREGKAPGEQPPAQGSPGTIE